MLSGGVARTAETRLPVRVMPSYVEGQRLQPAPTYCLPRGAQILRDQLRLLNVGDRDFHRIYASLPALAVLPYAAKIERNRMLPVAVSLPCQ